MLHQLEYDYYRPANLAELAGILKKSPGQKPFWLAGGSDLWVDLRKGKKTANLVIDLKRLPGLTEIREIPAAAAAEEWGPAGLKLNGKAVLSIGALTTIHRLETDPLILQQAPALAKAASCLGSLQVRNRATLGGNLANGAPTADTAAPMLALDALLHIWGPAGERIVPADQFWTGPAKSCLKDEEILLEILLPCRGGSSAYLKQGPRQAMDIGILSAAVYLRVEKGVTAEASIALGGAASVPLSCPLAAESLHGRPAEAEAFIRAGQLAAAAANPRNSRRASRAYRLELIPVLVERALLQARKGQEEIK